VNPYPISAEALDLEVYVLAALFTGSEVLAALGETHRGLRWVRATFESSEVSRRLISLAVMIRSHLDVSPEGSHEAVGLLVTKGEASSQGKSLTLREACNKIIHAESVSFSAGEGDQSSMPPVSPEVILEGTHGRREWTAHLNAIEFLEAAATQS